MSLDMALPTEIPVTAYSLNQTCVKSQKAILQRSETPDIQGLTLLQTLRLYYWSGDLIFFIDL